MLPLGWVVAVGLACTDLGRIGCAVDADCCDGGVCVRNRCLPSVPTTTDTTVPPTSTTSTTLPTLGAICRPTGADLAVLVHPRGAYYLNFHGQTADQQERDCLESTATSLVVKALSVAGDLLDAATRRRLLGSNGLSLPLTRIQVIPPYRGCLQQPGGCVWQLGPQGRNYQEDWTMGVILRDALMAVPAAAAARFATEPNLRDFLDVNATFDGPAELGPFAEVPYDPHREDAFPIDTHHALPGEGLACFTGDCTGLADTEFAHACDADVKCSRPLSPDCAASRDAGITVATTHARYEAGCDGDEDCQWQRRMPVFLGFTDLGGTNAGWTDTERCQWATITDVFHTRWEAAQFAGNAKAALFEGGRHRTAHTCLNVGTDPSLLVVLPEDGMDASDFASAYGGAQSCRDLLPLLVAAYGITP